MYTQHFCAEMQGEEPMSAISLIICSVVSVVSAGPFGEHRSSLLLLSACLGSQVHFGGRHRVLRQDCAAKRSHGPSAPPPSTARIVSCAQVWCASGRCLRAKRWGCKPCTPPTPSASPRSSLLLLLLLLPPRSPFSTFPLLSPAQNTCAPQATAASTLGNDRRVAATDGSSTAIYGRKRSVSVGGGAHRCTRTGTTGRGARTS